MDWIQHKLKKKTWEVFWKLFEFKTSKWNVHFIILNKMDDICYSFHLVFIFDVYSLLIYTLRDAENLSKEKLFLKTLIIIK